MKTELKLTVPLSIFGIKKREILGAWTYNDGSCRVTYKCNIFPTYYIEISLEKSQYITVGLSFFSRTVFELARAGSLSYPKQVT